MKNRRVFFDIEKQVKGSTRGCLVLVQEPVPVGVTPSSDLLRGRVANPDDWIPLGPVLAENMGDLAFVHRDVSIAVSNRGSTPKELNPGDGGVTAVDFIPAVANPNSKIGLLWARMTRPSTHSSARRVIVDGTEYTQVCPGISNWWCEGSTNALEIIPSSEYETLAAEGAFGEDGLTQLHKLTHRNFARFESAQTQIAKQKAEQQKALQQMEETRRAAQKKYEAEQPPVLAFVVILVILSLGFLGLYLYLAIEYKKDAVGGTPGDRPYDL